MLGQGLYKRWWLLCIAALSLAACNPTRNDVANTFRMNMSGKALESLDPAFAKDQYMMWTANMIYNTLVATDAQLHLSPSLAKSWTISDDGLTYIFILRNDVYFHDNPAFENGKGRKMTAADVMYSFNRITDSLTASPGAWIFNDRVIEKEPFVAVNDTTFIIKPAR